MDIVSTNEIAEMIGVKPGTVHAWRQRSQFPAPEWTVSGTPVWRRETIEAWARHGGRQIAETMVPSEFVAERIDVEMGGQRALEAALGLPGALSIAQRTAGDRGWMQATDALAEALLVVARQVQELSFREARGNHLPPLAEGKARTSGSATLGKPGPNPTG